MSDKLNEQFEFKETQDKNLEEIAKIEQTILSEVNLDAMLNKYGPEGCYFIAKELMKIVEDDTTIKEK